MQKQSSFSSVIRHKGFLNLWINQIIVQLSYNSLNFALIIWVFRLTNSNTAVSALLFAVYLPAVLLGLFSGILVDIVDKKKIIIAINIGLVLCFLSLITLKFSFPAILAIAFLVNTLAQFYSPAESSAIPLLVPKNQLLVANSLFSITLFSAFLLGFGLAGPIIHLFGIDFVFAFGAFILFIGFLFSFAIPSLKNAYGEKGIRLIAAIKSSNLSSMIVIGKEEMTETMRIIRGKISLMASLIILSGAQVIIGILGVLIPSFFEITLQINVTDASYILVIPLGLGMVTGGILIGKYGYKFSKRKIVSNAIILAGLLLFSVGAAPLISPVIHYFPKPKPLPFFYQPPLAAILAIGSFLLGIAMVSVVVPSQTVLQENTPESDRGKVFSVLGVLMSALTLVPVVLTGILSDVFGATPIFIAMGGFIALIGLLALKPDFYFEEHSISSSFRQFLGSGHWKKRR